MKSFKILIPVLLTLCAFASSCIKPKDFPTTPILKFMSFSQYRDANGVDTSGVLRFSFTDGDGDIGLSQGDTLPPFHFGGDYYHNFVIKYFEKKNGVFVEVNLPLSNNARIPNLTPKGQNKSLEGDIELNLFINNPMSNFDTIRYEFFIYDRALHKSNVVVTPEIKVNK